MIFLLHDQNKLPIKKPGFISVFCSKNIFRESGADNGGGWRQSRDLHHSSAEKTWNRKLLSDTKEKTGYRWRWSWREIASSNFAKDSTTSARFCVVSNSNKYFFIHHWFETQSDQWLSYSLFSVEALVWSSRQRGTILNQILDNFKRSCVVFWFVIGCFFLNWSCSIIFMYSTIS